MYWLIGLGIFLLLDLFIFGLLYNSLVKKRNRMREGWSGVEVQLKRRHNLVPNLVECVKAYQSHEKETLKKVTRARNAHGAREAGAAEEELGRDVGKMIALVEDYPALKANAQFTKLMDELVETEDQLQYSRRYYNGAVRDLNNAVESFPSNVIASAFSFQRADFFEVSEAAERTAVKISL